MKKRRRKLFLTEFIVEVYEDRIEWGGLDKFLWLLLHKSQGNDFLPVLKKTWEK